MNVLCVIQNGMSLLIRHHSDFFGVFFRYVYFEAKFCDQILWKWLTIGHFLLEKNLLRYSRCQLSIALSRWIKEKYSYAIWWLQKVINKKKMYFSTHIVPISGASNRIIRIFVTFGTFTCIPAPTHTHTQNFMFPNLTDSQFHKHVVLTLRSVSKSFISVML